MRRLVGVIVAALLPGAAWADACTAGMADYINCEGRAKANDILATESSHFGSYTACAPGYAEAGPDKIYGFTCAQSNHVKMELSGYFNKSGGVCNADLFVIPACAPNSCIGGDYRRIDTPGNPDVGTSTVEFDCVAGVQYYVVVEAFAVLNYPAGCSTSDGFTKMVVFKLTAHCNEICDDGFDNDKDDVVDCDDPDCYDSSACCDADHDGVNGYRPIVCSGGTDCEPDDAAVHPGALEVVADGVDQDCDAKDACWADVDLDGYGASSTLVSTDLSCAHEGMSAVRGDCLDGNDHVHPGATEVVADGVDEDCDGKEICWEDDDGDLFGVEVQVTSTDADCTDPGEAPFLGDCAPGDRRVHPLATEVVADFVDQDCDGVDDCFQDLDGDLFGSSTVVHGDDLDCTGPLGEAAVDGDCNDALATAYPGATEIPYDGIDQDCTGADLVDVDRDGAPGGPTGTDCDDGNAAIRPGAAEILLDGIDQDCSGGDLCLADPDGDGFGDGTTVASPDLACTGPGEATRLGDCAPTLGTVYPGAPEIPYDTVDQDCSGADLVDADGDGVRGGPGAPDCNDHASAVRPSAPELANGVDDDCDDRVDEGTDWGDDDADGVAEAGGDCDDADRTVHPGAVEVSNGVDDDCDGLVDEGTPTYDDDGDGWSEVQGDCNDKDQAVHPGAAEGASSGVDRDCDGHIPLRDADHDGYAPAGGDCDDDDATRSPAVDEVANGVDDDCDGTVDEGTVAADDDRDGVTEQDGDCDDTDPLRHPGATEDPANRRDDDCDGAVDEGGRFVDDDGDGVTEDQGDCDDGDPDVYPYAPELPNGVDDDCDKKVDDGVGDADGDGWSVAAGDCNDESGWANPERAEVCDGIDNDCDEVIDEGCDQPVVDDTDTATDGGGGCDTGGRALGLLPAVLALVALRRHRRGPPERCAG